MGLMPQLARRPGTPRREVYAYMLPSSSGVDRQPF